MTEPTNYVALKAPQFDKTKNSASRLSQVSPNASLEHRCRAVICAHLEQYPVDCWGVLAEHEWDEVLQMRYKRTAPQKGTRRAPSISERYVKAVEEENPHLAESAVASTLVWRDVVELKFPTAGIGRPKGLQYPWPILVQRIQKGGSDLLQVLKDEEQTQNAKKVMDRAMNALTDAPMNVALLQETGIGKTLKKFIKLANSTKREERAEELGLFRVQTSVRGQAASSPMARLEELLTVWKAMAARSGVDMQEDANDDDNDNDDDDMTKPNALLTKAASCQTWRDLYHLLQSRETSRREKQGAKMRKKREQRARTQPKILKVRPSTAGRTKPLRKSDAIAHRPVGTKFGSGGNFKNKMEGLRAESRVAASWSRSAKGGASAVAQNGSGFGNAVAFCSVGKSAKRLKGTPVSKTVALAGGKRMKTPSKIPASTLKKKLSKPVRR